MKLPPGTEKWVSAALGVLALALVVNLVVQYRGTQPGAHVSHDPFGPVHTRVTRGPSHVADDLVKYDPQVHFDALKAQDQRALPDEDRNPFEFVGGAPAPAPVAGTRGAPVGVAQPPPPPPPPPIKAVGYNQLPGGKDEAMVTYNDDLEVVHVGDIVGSRFTVVKITPTTVVVQDGQTHQNLELPIPQ